MIQLRLRSQISDNELEQKLGKLVTEDDYNMLLTGPAKILKPNGAPLCIYLPGAVSGLADPGSAAYSLLHSLRIFKSDNRGPASGSERLRYGDDNRTRTKRVRSTIIGSFDPGGPKQFCRLTSWNAQYAERFTLLYPLFRRIDENFREYAPERYAIQKERADATNPDWIIPGTVFTTITVNNTYPTGVHTDSGDLESGFSTLAVFRRGEYEGGELVFPRFRVAVDMQDGDLILMDAHEYHGNVSIMQPIGAGTIPDGERISVVSYFRSRMAECGSADDEYRKALLYAERRGRGRDRTGREDSGEDDSDGERATADA